ATAAAATAGGTERVRSRPIDHRRVDALGVDTRLRLAWLVRAVARDLARLAHDRRGRRASGRGGASGERRARPACTTLHDVLEAVRGAGLGAARTVAVRGDQPPRLAVGLLAATDHGVGQATRGLLHQQPHRDFLAIAFDARVLERLVGILHELLALRRLV